MSARSEISRLRTESIDDACGDLLPRVLPPGTLFAGRYQLEEVIGIGGYAVVYSAVDRHLSTRVAIKVLRMDRLTEPAMRRFRREVLIARGAESPYLLRLYDIGDTAGTLYITMELVDGVSLREAARDTPLPIERVIEIGRDAARALSALHRLGIVHHDVKPENILVSRTGEIKLADFGLARYIGEERLTQTGAVMGTCQYLSPEQALGSETGPRSDLYSLGVVLFELLTGALPYWSRTSLGALLAHVQQRPRDVQRLRPDVPRWLARMVARLLEKDPADRYASAAELERDLERRTTPLPWPRRRRAVAAAVLSVTLLGLLSACGWGWRAWRDSRFHSFTADDDGIHAIDRAGRRLWEMRDVWAANVVVARVRPEGRPVAVAFPNPRNSGTDLLHAYVLDLQTGERLRQLDFPVRSYFPTFSNTFFCNSVMATDLDGDGWDEVVAAFAHWPYFPSFTRVVDGQTGTIQDLFVAAGRHDPIGAIDLDADGRREVIFVGTSNRMGWYTGVAAVRWPPPSARAIGYATTPNLSSNIYGSDALAWYALLPAGAQHMSRASIDERRQRIRIAYSDGRALTLDGEGFPVESPPAAATRQQSRSDAYAALREASRALEGGLTSIAVLRCDDALRSANAAGDAMLAQWATRVRIRTLIAAGRSEEAAAALAAFRAAPADLANTAWDAARSYHLSGFVDDAVRWYRAGYARGEQYGRLRWEYIDGIVLALTEHGRFDEALQEIERFAAVHPDDLEAEWCRRFVRWRQTGKVEWPQRLSGDTDLHRYWDIEFRLANGESGDALARSIEESMRATSEVDPLLLSAKAELFARRGFAEEARAMAAQAVRDAEAVAAHDPVVRAHLPVLRART